MKRQHPRHGRPTSPAVSGDGPTEPHVGGGPDSGGPDAAGPDSGGPTPGPGAPSRAPRPIALALRALDTVLRVVRRPRSPRIQGVIAVVTVLLLAVGTVLAVSNLPADTEWRWWPLAILVVVGTPWAFVLLAAEVGLTGRLAGVRLRRDDRVRVAVVGSAMNQLPLPGAVITRLDALVNAGARTGTATAATLAVALVWVSTSSVVAAAALVGRSWAALILVGIALVAGLAVAGLVRRSLPCARRPDLARAVALELVFTATSALRFALALAALDAAIPVRGVAAMAASAALSSVVGLAPGGLGIREALATILGPAAGVPASLALLAALVNRAAGVLGALLTSLVVLPVLQRRGVAGTPVPGEGSPR